MKKVKRFQEGGYEDTDDYKNLMKAQAREDANAAEPGTETTASRGPLGGLSTTAVTIKAGSQDEIRGQATRP